MMAFYPDLTFASICIRTNLKKEACLFTALAGSTVQCSTCRRRCVRDPGRQARMVQDSGERGRQAFEPDLWGGFLSLHQPHREEAGVPLLSRVAMAFPGERGVQLPLCPGCQNWEIAHWGKGFMGTDYLSPGNAVSRARDAGCLGISWAFSEPALWFEYTLDAAKAAKEQGLFTNYVTNGCVPKKLSTALVIP